MAEAQRLEIVLSEKEAEVKRDEEERIEQSNRKEEEKFAEAQRRGTIKRDKDANEKKEGKRQRKKRNKKERIAEAKRQEEKKLAKAQRLESIQRKKEAEEMKQEDERLTEALLHQSIPNEAEESYDKR